MPESEPQARESNSPADQRPASPKSRGRLWRLSLKELRETLRDRRTIITLVCMPLLIYPLLGAVVQKLIIRDATQAERIQPQIGFVSKDEFGLTKQLIDRGEQLLQSRQAAQNLLDIPQAADEPESKPKTVAGLPLPGGTPQEISLADFVFLSEETHDIDLNSALIAGKVDVTVNVNTSVTGQKIFTLTRREGSPISRRTADLIAERLEAVNREDYRRRLLEAGLEDREAMLLEVATVVPEQGEAFSLKTFIPLVLILMTVTGAVYPAIDLTAGERERGTLETLIAAPVPRLSVLLSKFVAVLTVAMLTACVNLLAMTITVYATGMQALVFGEAGFTFSLFWQGGVLLVIFAAFYSAVLLALTSWARSFKEAQAYLIPLMLASLTPGVMGLMPGLQMNPLLAVTPLVNMVLLGRELLNGNVDPLYFLMAVTSTAAYGMLALWGASRIFGTDAILYGSSGSVADLFRRPPLDGKRPVLKLEFGLVGLMFVLPTFLVLGQAHSIFGDISMLTRLALSSLVTVLIFVLLPIALNFWWRVPGRTLFSLQRFSALHLVGALFLGASLWPYVYEIELAVLSPDRIALLKEAFASIEKQLMSVPLIVRLLTLAVVPAVCEELFFRGFLQSALAKRMSGVRAAILAAVLFGTFHVIVRDAIFFERFIPSTLLGIALGLVRYRTGSVWPGVLMHAMNNGLLLSIAHFAPKFQSLGIGDETRQHLPVLWLAIATGITLTGIALLSTRPRAADESDTVQT